STERVAAALTIVRTFLALKVPALVASPMLSELASSVMGPKIERSDHRVFSYLAHEFMAQHWDALFVTDVRSDLATIGLEPVGSATLVENHDAFVLGKAAREALAAIGDKDVRELARDFLVDQFFRCDVFVRDGKRLDEDEQRRRLLANVFAL